MRYRPPLPYTPIPSGKQEEYIKERYIDSMGLTHIDYGYCPECTCQRYIYDHHRGECVCPVCGLVLEDVTYTGAIQENVIMRKDGRATMNYSKQELDYIRENDLHLRQMGYPTDSKNALKWRLICHYASILRVQDVDKENIYQFMIHENLQDLKVSIIKIVLSLMKYLIGIRKDQDARIDRGVFKEENLTQKEYRRVIQFMFQKDDGRYGIVRDKDVTSKYYDWVWT